MALITRRRPQWRSAQGRRSAVCRHGGPVAAAHQASSQVIFPFAVRKPWAAGPGTGLVRQVVTIASLPRLGRIQPGWHTVAGQPSPYRTSGRTELDGAAVSLLKPQPHIADAWWRVATWASRIRILSTSCLEAVLVAEGSTDAFADAGSDTHRIVDLAAAMVTVPAAGGAVIDAHGRWRSTPTSPAAGRAWSPRPHGSRRNWRRPSAERGTDDRTPSSRPAHERGTDITGRRPRGAAVRRRGRRSAVARAVDGPAGAGRGRGRRTGRRRGAARHRSCPAGSGRTPGLAARVGGRRVRPAQAGRTGGVGDRPARTCQALPGSDRPGSSRPAQPGVGRLPQSPGRPDGRG